MRDWASVAGRGLLLLTGSIAHASLKTAVRTLNSPRRNIRFLSAESFVLISEELHILSVSALLEHLICLFLVERATHPTVRRVHGEDT